MAYQLRAVRYRPSWSWPAAARRPAPISAPVMDSGRTLNGYASGVGSAPGSGVTRPARPGRPTDAYPAPALTIPYGTNLSNCDRC
jgi:hypothetical protein